MWILILAVTDGFAQDVVFTQVFEQPLMVNPAYAVTKKEKSLRLNIRDQWRSYFNAPVNTYAASYNDRFMYDKKNQTTLAYGILALSDHFRSSSFMRNSLSCYISSMVALDEEFALAAGLYSGLVQNSFNPDRYSWGTQYNGFYYDSSLPTQESFPTENFFNGDIGCGMQVLLNREAFAPGQTKWVDALAGFSMHHVNRPRYSLDKNLDDQYMRYSYEFSISVKLWPRIKTLWFFYHSRQGQGTLWTFGGAGFFYFDGNNSKLKSISLGYSTNLNKSYFLPAAQSSLLTSNFKLEFEKWYFGFSYEYGIPEIINGKVNYFPTKGFEVAVVYYLSKENQ